MTGPDQEVHTRLTKEQAGAPPAHGQVFDEQEQRWMPLGEKFAVDRYRQQQEPEVMLAEHDARRMMVLRFVHSKMVEAEYDEKGYLIEGKLHHFYVVPGSKTKALTKTGGEMLADLFRLRRARSHVTHSVETAEYVSVRSVCDLVDQYGQPAGSCEGACTSAEAAFRAPFARRKYGATGKWEKTRGKKDEWVELTGPDYRAALHEIGMKSQKRAFVGSVIVATATDDIFEVAAEVDDDGVEKRPTPTKPAPEPTAQPSVPAAPPLTIQGKPLGACTTAELENAMKALEKMPDHRWDRMREAVTTELDQRRVDATCPGASDGDGSDLSLGS